MHHLEITLLAAVAGAATLLLFYRAIRTEWPSNYVSVETDFGIVINRSFLRYFLFTLGPTYLVSLFASTLADRSGGQGLACALLIAGVHIIRNNGRHAVLVVRHRHDQARYALLLVDGFNIFVVMLAALAGAAGPGPFPDIVPPAAEFFSSLWTTAFVAVVGVCLLYATRHRITIERLLDRSSSETQALTPVARSLAAEQRTEPALVLAILYTENLQRPGWIRWLERAKGRVWPAGTYGVMQITSDRPLSDVESIRRALADRLAGVRIGRGDYGFDSDDLERVLRTYNDNDEFVGLASQIYSHLYYVDQANEEVEPGAVPEATPDDHDVDGAIRQSSHPEDSEVRASIAVSLRMVVRLISDESAIVRIATSSSIEELRALASAVASLALVPTDQDIAVASAVRAALSETALSTDREDPTAPLS